jgi:tRNA threonylcarbamoyladenosine biosynthesis protein TsaE
MTPPDRDITTHSPEATRKLGRCIGSRIRSPLAVTLSGDLGCGKTAWVQGLAQGLNVPAGYYITSPTYTLVNQYPGRLTLYHLDLYRLNDWEDLEAIGYFEIISARAVVAIEWPRILGPDLPPEHLALEFGILGDQQRRIRLSGCGQTAADLIEGLG